MSASNKTKEIVNPSRYIYRWDGSEGKWSRYDRIDKEKTFVDDIRIALCETETFTVNGYQRKTNYYSNLAKDHTVHPLIVRNGDTGEIVAMGPYASIKEEKDRFNGRYVGILFGVDPGGNVCTVDLRGVAMGAFIDCTQRFGNKRDLAHFKLYSESKGEKKTNGATVYFVPTIKMVAMDANKDADLWEKVIEKDAEEIQPYLAAHFEAVRDNYAKLKGTPDVKEEPVKPAEPTEDVDVGEIASGDDDVPF